MAHSSQVTKSTVSGNPRKKRSIEENEITTMTTKRVKRVTNGDGVKYEESEEEIIQEKTKSSPTKPRKQAAKPKPAARSSAKSKKESEEVELKAEEDDEDSAKKIVKRKRKTKEEKDAEQQPLAGRTEGSKLFVGAHVSAAGGVHNAVTNSVHIGGNAFALFLKSQRKWTNPPLDPEHLQMFHSNCKAHLYQQHSHVVPHGSYLVNLAQVDTEKAKQALDTFIDDLDRCNRLGIKLYNFHPGNCAAAGDLASGIAQIAAQLNRAHAEKSSGNVITLLETMAAFGGNTIGTTFEQIRDIIEQVDDKSRVGVCLDTCHIFAAGYDIRTPAALTATLDKFDKIIGLNYLRALHVNDSKAPLGSARDLHAQIGTGFLGLRAFHALVNEPRLWGLPMVLETPIDKKNSLTGKEEPDRSIWAKEIKLLETLVGMDADSQSFKDLEDTLQEMGRAERDRIEGQVSRRSEKQKVKKEKEEVKQGVLKKWVKSVKKKRDEDTEDE